MGIFNIEEMSVHFVEENLDNVMVCTNQNSILNKSDDEDCEDKALHFSEETGLNLTSIVETLLEVFPTFISLESHLTCSILEQPVFCPEKGK
ncbi:hypothetical protein ILUMI_16958 [Ignelater luminosus]|uniref:Uncharacterized protein n=1 Tax=Ignelater luminosus TaxID=2038154 RepID=A0A8K0G810_IGNLU|nr:hypothetical protein ILUMI_16958 [Ignelater luminosus]